MAGCNLLLVGRTGNGKSSTGDAILGQKMFKPRSSSASGPTEILKGYSDIYGRSVCVVDGIDIDDNTDKDPKALLDRVEKALLVECNKNVDAFLFVLKYGVRFTKQEKEPVILIRSIFGENVLKNHGIIVMSHGDNFEMDMEDEGRSFQDWYLAQTGDVKSLFEECGSRVVLFDNKTKEHDMQKKQFEQLMEKVSEIKLPYTEANFSHAAAGRRKLIVNSRAPELRKTSELFVDGIYEHLAQWERNSDDIPASIEGLEKVQDDVKKHRQELEREDEGTQILSDCFTSLAILEKNIKSKLDAKRRQLKIAESKRDIEVKGIDDSGGRWSLFKGYVQYVWGKTKDFSKTTRFFVLVGAGSFILFAIWYFKKSRDLKKIEKGFIYPTLVGMSHSKGVQTVKNIQIEPIWKIDDNTSISRDEEEKKRKK